MCTILAFSSSGLGPKTWTQAPRRGIFLVGITEALGLIRPILNPDVHLEFRLSQIKKLIDLYQPILADNNHCIVFK